MFIIIIIRYQRPYTLCLPLKISVNIYPGKQIDNLNFYLIFGETIVLITSRGLR